jgi:hypothetical protein
VPGEFEEVTRPFPFPVYRNQIRTLRENLLDSGAAFINRNISNPTRDTNMMAYSTCLERNEGRQVLLYIFSPLYPVESTVEILSNQLIYITVISLLLALLLSIYLSRMVTKPFTIFEGRVRTVNASTGIERLKENVDTLIVVPNDKLLQIVERKVNMEEALHKADEVLQQSVQGITDMINVHGLINLDFADVSTVMKDKGLAHIGIGQSKGEDKALEAVKIAVESPLLETKITGATDVIIHLAGHISLYDAQDAGAYVQDLAGEHANIIFGANADSDTDEIIVTVIATGLEDNTTPMFMGGNFTKSAFKPSGSLGTPTNLGGGIKPVELPKNIGGRNTVDIPEFLKNKK